MTGNNGNGICSSESASPSGKPNILDLIGGNGPWQWRVCIVYFFLAIVGAHHSYLMTFLAPEQDYWCSKPAGANISKAEWIEFRLPPNDKKCSRYERINSTIPRNKGMNSTIVPCSSWEYDRSFYTSTLLTEWDLVCDRSWLVSLSKSVFMAGYLVAAVSFGHLSDRIGRRPTITTACLLMFFSSIICAFSSSFWMFLILRFFIGMGVGGFYNNLYVLMTEMVNSEIRFVYGTVAHLGWSMGIFCLPGIIWFVRNWFWIQIAVSAPGFISLFVCLMIPESPRWLLSAGKVEEARQTLLAAAKMNRMAVPNIDIAIEKATEELRKDFDSKESGGKFLTLLKTPGLWQMTMKIYFSWFVIVFTYYGFTLNTNQLAGDPLVNFAASGVIEFPGFLLVIFTIRCFGRKKSLAWTLIAGGLVCLVSYFVPKNMLWFSVAVPMVGQLCIFSCYAVAYVYTTELFPTTVRNTALGGAAFFARIGCIIAPFVRELGLFAADPYMPFIVYGVLVVTCGLVVLSLPETGDCDMPDTVKDMVKTTSRTENMDLPVKFSKNDAEPVRAGNEASHSNFSSVNLRQSQDNIQLGNTQYL